MERRILTKDEFRRMQLIELELLVEFDRVCRKHDIRYVIFCGTQLGAVRHQGYIPWDDDADIAMLREDFEKFRAVSEELNPSICFYQDHLNDPEYRWGFSKLRRTGTSYIRLGQEHIKSKTGIFIDIFPLDDIPTCVPLQVLQDFYCFFWRKVLWSKVGCENTKGPKRIWFKLLSCIPPEVAHKAVQPYITKNNATTPNKVRCLLFPAYGKLYVHHKLKDRLGMDKKWFLDRSEYLFEGKMFYGTKDYDSILTYIYDDYMTLPPEEKREQHAPISSIDFGD